MNIAIIGSGYVGLVTGACFAELGNRVISVDSNAAKIRALNQGTIPIYEPGLEELVKSNIRKKRLFFTTHLGRAVSECEIIFIAVGTPPQQNGEADLTGIETVARNIARNLTGYRLIVEKSTVPVETGKWVKQTIDTYVRRKVDFDVASNPEFLREGSAINDFMHPDRVVIGVESRRARKLLEALYKPLQAPMVVTDIKSAELIKHASNSFLAAKISFMNAIARICESVGADVVQVAQGMGLDRRIGPAFLKAGIGYGGSCFPKDLDAFITISEKLGYDFELLKAVREINRQQKEFFLEKIKDVLWIVKDKTIGILGLSFKPNTDDIRNAPSIDIIQSLQQAGAKIKVYDPVAMPKAKGCLAKVSFCKDPYDVCRNSDCLVVLTEWDEFKELDFKKIKELLRRPLVIDGRNIYDPKAMAKAGFNYCAVGRRKADRK